MEKVIATALFIICLAGFAQTNAAWTNRTWMFQKGGKFEGRVIDFKGTNDVILLSAKDRKPYTVTISTLAQEDQALLPDIRDQINDAKITREFERQAQELLKKGYVELTKKIIENYPEKVGWKNGWMDVEFIETSNIGVSFPSLEIGFQVRDKNGDVYWDCRADKESREYVVDNVTFKQMKMDDAILKLHRGDKVRLVGFLRTNLGNNKESWFTINEVQMIKPARARKTPD